MPSVADNPRKSVKSRRQTQLRAQRYRDNYLLPRYVLENGTKRKLKTGEFDPTSKLFPMSTPISEMSGFGIGIGM